MLYLPKELLKIQPSALALKSWPSYCLYMIRTSGKELHLQILISFFRFASTNDCESDKYQKYSWSFTCKSVSICTVSENFPLLYKFSFFHFSFFGSLGHGQGKWKPNNNHETWILRKQTWITSKTLGRLGFTPMHCIEHEYFFWLLKYNPSKSRLPSLISLTLMEVASKFI